MNYNFDKICERKNTDSSKWDTTKDGVIPMWVADMDFEVAPKIVESIIKKANHKIFGYTIISDKYYEAEISWSKKRFNFDLQKEWIEATTGVIPSLSTILQTFCKKGDKVLIQSPVYHYFNIAIKRNELEILTNNLVYKNSNYEINFEDFENKLKNEKPKLFILCNPHNPVGRVWRKDELIKMGELCLKYNVLVISDEIHRDLVFKDYSFIPFASICEDFLQNSITCTSATKTFNLAGLKASNIIVANQDLRVKLNENLVKNEIKSLNIFGIESTISAYEYCEDWLEELLIYLEKNRDFLENFIAKNIPNIKVIKAEATYLMWLDISNFGLDSTTFTKKLEEIGKVRVISGSTFGENGDNFIRVNIACPKKILEQALNALKFTIENL
ncbi:MalY/PatB family protein [Aliarcobacter thereius]|uniref:cysteine-S-conjugate beta-lyase n=1 Tax=Aliarcobacter thereius LMG 24486 TaxID=1032240 RepID=A0A1C7WU13_9BACT|nr:MalY/PatB family protein [Aliarcobacter thereius]OCL90073.1 Cystathionine beta-lyase PatB [Aliarcobacter thereius]OCL96327.1 Cystathionine beta-lyase PatB [Aliarcobacter thereius LMG 24486]QBF15710.1 putative C-S lyase [Aliarcobacter thereius LMG 24486]TLS92506.1 pyridoxal phosphate-dependent aminotransferase [Aliarcobacter thereius]TLT06972.1 pyridoxal phosphate-dependent aminotransferase [Aliarcobacter thereius]